MKTLCLLRHAQASRRIDREDFDRPLSPHGLDTAQRAAELMRAERLVPDLVLCSGARRARETWEALAPHLASAGARQVPLDLRDDLYLASHARLLSALHKMPDGPNAVLMIAHNPGLQRLTGGLSGPESRASALATFSRGYPAAALAVLTFATRHWAEIAPGGGRLERFLVPTLAARGG